MAKYNLTGSLEKSFTFSIDDKEFEFRKPTVREMREIAKIFSAIEKEADPDKQIEKSDAAMGELYKFISPVGHSENVADLLADQPVDAQNAFNNMIKAELGANN